jgi:hypothetical protein
MSSLKKIEINSQNKVDILRIVHRKGLDFSTLIKNMEAQNQDYGSVLLVSEKKVEVLQKYHGEGILKNKHISEYTNLLISKKLSSGGEQEEYTASLGYSPKKPSMISVSGEISSGSDLRNYNFIIIEGEGKIHLSQKITDSIDGETRVKQALGRILREDNGIKYAMIPTEYDLDFNYLSNLAKKIEVYDFEKNQYVDFSEYEYNPKFECKNPQFITDIINPTIN